MSTLSIKINYGGVGGVSRYYATNDARPSYYDNSDTADPTYTASRDAFVKWAIISAQNYLGSTDLIMVDGVPWFDPDAQAAAEQAVKDAASRASQEAAENKIPQEFRSAVDSQDTRPGYFVLVLFFVLYLLFKR